MKLIDNINTLLGDDLKQTIEKGAKIKIAASTFSIYAFEALKKQLHSIDSLDFIFTSPTFLNEVTDSARKAHREFHIPKEQRERSFYGTDFEIQLKNRLTQRAVAKECADWIRKKAVFRSNRGKVPMQQFACITTKNNQAVYQPLNGFTAVDLGYQQGDAVSNFVNKIDDSNITNSYLSLFDQIWNDTEKIEDVTERLCQHISSVYQENAPERIYFLMLYNIFSEFLDDISEDVLPNDRTGYQDSLIWNALYNFQRDAANGIINKLETFNGCILADSVGLGKTFTALAVIKYYELRNRSVLVLCPKKLADNWLNYNRNLKTNPFARDRLGYEVLCHTDLQRTKGYSFGTPLDKINWGNYDLVVIDESHNFRNNPVFKDRETRYQRLLNSVIKEGVKTKVLMLSATPVNNRFTDLRNQLALAYEGDSSNLSKKLRVNKDIEKIFREAQAEFNAWSKLPAEERTVEAILNALDFDFFELLDSVTIARSRKHIKQFYDTSEFGSFPTRRPPKTFHPPLTQRTDVINLDNIYTQLTTLQLAVYAPVSYILPSRISKYEAIYDTDVSRGSGKLKQIDRERSLQALMTTNLLKRLESSVEAFRLTLHKLQNNHIRVLEKIASYTKSGSNNSVSDVTGAYADCEPGEEEILDPDNDQIGGKVSINLADMDIPSWERDLRADLEIIQDLVSELDKIGPEEDTKLQHLKSEIEAKINAPINPGNRKVLIFTAFADTVHYLYNNLALHFLNQNGIHTARVTGSDNPKSTLGKGYDFQSLLTLFAPQAKEKSKILPNNSAEIDILIGTDCISEGQNFQDCDYMINYDIHWNPVRIIQRFGRIDRIGSPNSEIQLVNYWPDISLDEYINLKERVENRMTIVDMAATADENMLSNEFSDIAYRKEQLRRLQEEVIDMEDVKTGVSITDLGLNDFRMDLLGYIKNQEDLSNLPSGMHTVVPAEPERGLYPGVIFTLRNCNHEVNIQQQNRLHPFYLVYIDNNGQIIADYTQVKLLLDMARTACRDQSKPIPSAYNPFNKQTDDGRDMSFYSGLLDQAIGNIIQVQDEKDLDSLFTGSRTSALTNTISGLEDFELMSFIVVQETEQYG